MNDFVPRKVLGKFMHVTDIALKRESGKSLVFFMGAGFCPYCAAERWAISGALSRFGTWSGLSDDASAGHDEKYLNVPTVSFVKAKYHSESVEFVARETADRNFEPLDELKQSDYEILDMYNPDQIIPFLLIDGQYAQVGSGYSPELIQGLKHATVRSEIENLHSSIGKAINGEIDNITALICKSLKNNKTADCQEANIKKLLEKI